MATAPSKEALDAILREDPFHVAQVATYEVTEFIPTMTSTEGAFLKTLG